MIPSNINTFGVHDQYEKYYKYYSKKYGKVAVMYQHGAHYNFFGTEDCGNVAQISQDITLRLTYTDKNKDGKGTKSNPMMAGFPITARNDYIEKLIMNGYVVVEIKENKAKKQKGDRLIPREVVGVYTPGTYITEFSEENYVVYLYIKGHKDQIYQPMSIGMSSIDVNTGISDYDEVYNTPDDEGYAVDEVYRYIQAHTPKEIVVTYVDTDFRLEDSCYIFKTMDVPEEMKKDSARMCFLDKVFKNRGICDVIDYLDLESKMFATMSLTLLYYYVSVHNKTLAENLKKPSLWYSESHMLLANNSIEQLDILNSKKGNFENVFNLVDFTSTSMGRRLLKSRIVNPIRSSSELERRYDWVEKFHNWKVYEELLSGMVDLQREHRKIECGSLTPLRMSFLIETYRKMLQLLEICPPDFVKSTKGTKRIKRYVEEMEATFDLEECSKYDSMEDILSNIFKKGFSEKFDKIGTTIEKCWVGIEKERERVRSCLSSSANPPIEKDSNQGYYIRLTHAQAKKVDRLVILPSRVKSYVWARTEKMVGLSDKLLESEHEICGKMAKYYQKFLRYIESEHRNAYMAIVKFVAEVDVYKSSAKCAERYKYCRPTTTEKEKGYISCENLRHPLVERIGKMYVPHTLKIGNEKGLLVFGMNASGKSSMMKALGINLVLAQAGLYVAASKFRFTPYTSIQTRILGNDNILRGLSSFAVEMSELRGIMNRACNKSLVLGDEICHGTETVSGLAIVATSIIQLLEKEANFIFATHLHELPNMDEIKKLDCLGIYHLKVEREGRKLIYRRQLEPGPGDSLYGLEVARALNLPESFIEKANSIRKKIVDEEVLGRKSRYGTNYLNRCALCGKRADHDHHIRFQKEADENGFIEHFHKNHPLNRVGLCEKCHVKLHKGDIDIRGYIETSEGIVLDHT